MRGLFLLIIVALALAGCAAFADGESSGSSQRATVIAEADQDQPPVIVYQRNDENSDDMLEWRIYADGRAVTITTAQGEAPEVVRTETEPQKVSELMRDLEKVGFLEAAQPGEADCCDDNEYALTVRRNDVVNSITIEAITPELAVSKLQSINFVEKFIFEEINGAVDK